MQKMNINKNSWLVPCNIKYYDIEGVYKNLESVDWKQSVTKVEKGDIVYIYVSAPISAIVYKCIVEEVNKVKVTIDDTLYRIISEPYEDYGRYMQLKFLDKYDSDELSFGLLSKNGLKGRIQCQRCIDSTLLSFIENKTARK